MTHRVEISLSVTLASPFILPGLGAAALGIDVAALRDEQKRPVLPGDQVKGLLRAAMVSMKEAVAATQQDIIDLFGQPSSEGTGTGEGNVPERGSLITGDLVATGANLAIKQENTLTRIAIDQKTGTVQRGALQVIELVAPLGEHVEFLGTAILYASPGAAQRWVSLLEKAWALVPAIGSAKSAGFGRVAAQSLRAGPPTLILPPLEKTAYPPTVWLDVTFDRRLLVDAQRLSDNVWRGSTIIPGTVIKGALARMLKLAGEEPTTGPLGDALQTIRVSHAFPLDCEGRELDLPIPLSAVKLDGQCSVRDVLLVRHGAVPFGANGELPAYQGDWKGRDTTDGLPHQSQMSFSPRLHTRIGENYTAADGDLYGDIGLSPWLKPDEGIKRCWRLRIDRHDADQDWYARFLDLLLKRGLDGIGKTGASAQFIRTEREHFIRTEREHWPLVQPVAPGTPLWAVTLITPTMMLPQTELPDDAEALEKAYAAYWSQALGQGCRLRRFFAAHRLAGGYIGIRRRHFGNDQYHPFVLTEPGSVFLLQGDLKDGLQRLMGQGLPAHGKKPHDWRTCPFLPENGFGDFRLNLIDHKARSNGIAEIECGGVA